MSPSPILANEMRYRALTPVGGLVRLIDGTLSVRMLVLPVIKLKSSLGLHAMRQYDKYRRVFLYTIFARMNTKWSRCTFMWVSCVESKEA